MPVSVFFPASPFLRAWRPFWAYIEEAPGVYALDRLYSVMHEGRPFIALAVGPAAVFRTDVVSQAIASVGLFRWALAFAWETWTLQVVVVVVVG